MPRRAESKPHPTVYTQMGGRRNSPPYAEPYAMPFQPSPTTTKSDVNPLLTPEEFREIVALLERNTNRVRSVRREVFSIQSVFTCVLFLLFLGRNLVTFGTTVTVIGVNAVLAIYINEHHHRRDKRIAPRLLKFVEDTQDVRQLGTILDLYDTVRRLDGRWLTVYTATHSAVVRLLPWLQSQDADVLNTQQRERLRHDLFRRRTLFNNGYWRGVDYCLTVLSALEQIGDKRDLPDVERLRKEAYITDDIRAAVEHCAEAIRERIAREEGKDFLLRGYRKPESVEILLRPSVANVDTPPELLLRAAISDAHDPPA